MNIIVNQAAQEHGMGPRGSALICGYTNYHRQLESSLADLQTKEVRGVLQYDYKFGRSTEDFFLYFCLFLYKWN